jgi:hypothetical protein
VSRRHRALWQRARAIVLAAVVLVGGFGLPAFDAIAYHWHQSPATERSGLPRLQQFGTPADHSVLCILTHNAPAPRLASSVAATVRVTSTVAACRARRPTAVLISRPRHLPDQPRAPPASIA